MPLNERYSPSQSFITFRLSLLPSLVLSHLHSDGLAQDEVSLSISDIQGRVPHDLTEQEVSFVVVPDSRHNKLRAIDVKLLPKGTVQTKVDPLSLICFQ